MRRITTKGIRRVTAKKLRELGACPSEVERFEKLHPKGLAVTKRNCLLVARERFDLDWFAKRVLPPQLLKEFERQRAPLWEEYERQVAPLWEEFERKRALLGGEFERQEAPLWGEYAPLWGKYKRQEALLWGELERQVAPLLEGYWRQRALLFWGLLRQEEGRKKNDGTEYYTETDPRD